MSATVIAPGDPEDWWNPDDWVDEAQLERDYWADRADMYWKMMKEEEYEDELRRAEAADSGDSA